MNTYLMLRINDTEGPSAQCHVQTLGPSACSVRIEHQMQLIILYTYMSNMNDCRLFSDDLAGCLALLLDDAHILAGDISRRHTAKCIRNRLSA